jgi:alpha-1,6-mannosyltransferase
MSAPSSALRWRINSLGVVILAVHLVLAALSYFQAAALWNVAEFPRAAAFFESLGSQSAAITADPSTWLAAARLFIHNTSVMLSYGIPLAIATIAAAVLILMLIRHGDAVDAAIARLLFRWSLAFAAASFFAFPLFTQDFWLSAAWGRMIAAGVNPFHTLFTAQDLVGLPLDHFPMTMSYGPLWAVLSALITLIAFDNVIAMGLLFKGVIAAAWIWTLVLIDRLQHDKSPRERCLAIALFGWVPLGVSQSIAEGHNDIVMIAPALLWFLLLLRRHPAAPLALAVSALCKYVTAPLFVIDLIQAFRGERLTLLRYVRRMLLPGLVGAVLVTFFFRSPSFFDGLRLVSEWHFLRPSEAVSGVEQLTGIPLWPLHLVALAAFPIVAVLWLAAFIRNASVENLTKATIALIAAIMFTAASHVWPWYLVWGVAFSALLPQWWVSRFVAGVALLIPFTLATWWVPALEPLRDIAALAIYGGAVLWIYLTREQPTSANQ